MCIYFEVYSNENKWHCRDAHPLYFGSFDLKFNLVVCVGTARSTCVQTNGEPAPFEFDFQTNYVVALCSFRLLYRSYI